MTQCAYSDVNKQMNEPEKCHDALMSTNRTHLSSSAFPAEELQVSEDSCRSEDKEDPRATGYEESRQAAARPGDTENALDKVMLANKEVEKHTRESKSSMCLLEDTYQCKHHFEKMLEITNNIFKEKDNIAREYVTCKSSSFVNKAEELLQCGDSGSRNVDCASAVTDLCWCNDVTKMLQESIYNVNTRCVTCDNNVQIQELCSTYRSNRKQEGADFRPNKQVLLANMLPQLQSSCMNETCQLCPHHMTQFISLKTESDTTLSVQHRPSPDHKDAHHKQAGMLMTTVCATFKTEPVFIHSTKSPCKSCKNELRGVYSSASSLHHDNKILGACIVSPSSVTKDAVLIKSDKSHINSQVKYLIVKPYCDFDGDKTKAQKYEKRGNNETRENTVYKEQIQTDFIKEHQGAAVSAREAENVHKRVELETEKGGQVIRKHKSCICMLQNAYQGKDEVDTIWGNRIATLKDQGDVAGEQFISCDDNISSSYFASTRSAETTRNASLSFRFHKFDLEMMSEVHCILENIVTILESNQGFFNVLDGKVTRAFKNYFSDVTLFISANRNKSGNSGYNSMRSAPFTGNTLKKSKKPGPTVPVGKPGPIVPVGASTQNQRLQSCLEKTRLACTLHGTIGHMRNRADNYAAVMAYEQSVKDLEASMKDFLELDAGNTTEDGPISEWRPPEIDNPNRRACKGAKQQSGQCALRRSETFVIEDPFSYNLSRASNSKRDNKDVSVKKYYILRGRKWVKEIDTEGNDDTLICSSDSTHPVCFSPALKSADNMSEIASVSQNSSHLNRTKTGKPNRHSSCNTRCASATEKRMRKHKYGNKSHDSHFDISEFLSSTEETVQQVDISVDLSQSFEKPRCDNINEMARSNHKEATLRHSDNYVNINDSIFPDVGILNDELGEIARPKHPSGNVYLRKSLLLPDVPARTDSLNEDIFNSQKARPDNQPDVSSDDREKKKHIESKSDMCLSNGGPLNAVNSVAKEYSDDNNKCKVPQGFQSLETLTQKNVAVKDIPNSMIINDRTMSRSPALFNEAINCTRQHATYSNSKEIHASVNDECIQEYHISSQEQSGLERAQGIKQSIFNSSSLGPMKSSHCSSHTSVGPHKRWRLPTSSRNNVFLQLCSDIFPPKTDWSNSDEDTIDDLQLDLNRYDIRGHRHNEDVNTKLHELNQYVRRRNKYRTPLRKRSSTESPSWVGYAEKGNNINSKTLILDTEDNISGSKYCDLKSAHVVYQAKQFTAEYSKLGTEERDGRGFSLKESKSVQELMSVSQLFNARNKAEAAELHKCISARDETCVEIVDNESCVTTTDYWSNATGDRNSASSEDMMNTLIEKTLRGSLLQEKYPAACSAVSPTSGENAPPRSQICKERTSESGFKSNNSERKFITAPDTSYSQLIPQSQETDVVSEVFTNLSQIASRSEEAGGLIDPLSDLSSNIDTSTFITRSCSQEQPSTTSISTRVLSKSSGGTFVNQSCTDFQTTNVSSQDLETNGDDYSWSSKKISEIEHRVREISATESKIIQFPYPYCFLSVKDDTQFVHQGKEDLPNEENKYKSIKMQNNDTSVACHVGEKQENYTPVACLVGEKQENYTPVACLVGEKQENYTPVACLVGETQVETPKMYSVRSPPKCLCGNKQLYYSYIINMSNPLIFSNKQIRCSSEVDDKETFPFSIVGDDFDSSSPYENDPVDFAETSSKKNVNQTVNADSSDELKLNGSKFQYSRSGEEHAIKYTQRTRTHNSCSPLCFITNFQYVDNDPLTSSSQRRQERRGDCANKIRSAIEDQSVRKDLREFQNDNSQCTDSQNDNAIIKELRNKVKYLEHMLVSRNVTNHTFQHKSKNIGNTGDSVLSKQPNWLQRVATQSLVQSQLCSTMQHKSMLHHCCCTQTTEPSNNESPNRYLLTPCRCVRCACSHHPLGYQSTESKIIGRKEEILCTSAACQTVGNYECTDHTRISSCSLVDDSTQCDADMSDERAHVTNQLLEVQMSQMHADIQAIKHHALLGSLQSLHESVSVQKKELREMSSKMENIASSLEDSKDDLTKKEVYYDKMKERITELTLQRDAEKAFHKITRHALRSLERDHDRLRQEFFHANCRRFRDGESLVQKRVWHYLKGDDKTCHNNTNNSSIRRYQPVFERLSARHIGQENVASKFSIRKSDYRFLCHSFHKTNSKYQTLHINCCHFTHRKSAPEVSTHDFRNTQET